MQNLECQISTVLMKRFLDGETLPQNLLEDLERHLQACPDCKALVEDEKVSLETLVQPLPAQETGWNRIASKLSATGAGTPSPVSMVTTNDAPGMAAFNNRKVLVLSISLALVLIAMSTIAKNPTTLFGKKASESQLVGNLQDDASVEADDLAISESGQEETSDDHGDDTDGHGTDLPHGPTEEGHNENEEHTTPPEAVHGQSGTHVADATTSTTSSDGHHTDEPSTQAPVTKSTVKDDPRVPGKPTLPSDDVIVVGGKGAASGSQNTLKKDTPPSSSAKKPSPSTPAKKPATKPSSAPKQKKSGIVVYDANGKPIR